MASSTTCSTPWKNAHAHATRSMVGLIPLFAVDSLDPETLRRTSRLHQAAGVVHRPSTGPHGRGGLHANARAWRDAACFRWFHRSASAGCCSAWWTRMNFCRPTAFGRISAAYRHQPYVLEVAGMRHEVRYEPGESSSGLFGGNSNWRGPIWFPVNYLLIESLQKFHHYLGDDFTIEYPARSGQQAHLGEVAADLSRRLSSIFLRDAKRPTAGLRQRATPPEGPSLL